LLPRSQVQFFLYKTRAGLAVWTVGANPFAADTVGVNVNLKRRLWGRFLKTR
jgi:ABC-type uncharacterized transport system permease subunit